jgi:uncharacterized protein YcfJ
VIGGFVLGAVIGFIIGFMMGAAGSTREHLTLVTSTAGLFVGLIWAIAVLKKALEKQYDDFRIALIER